MDYFVNFLTSHVWEVIGLTAVAFVSYWFGRFKGYWAGFFYARACRDCPRFRECPECGSMASPPYFEKYRKKKA